MVPIRKGKTGVIIEEVNRRGLKVHIVCTSLRPARETFGYRVWEEMTDV